MKLASFIVETPLGPFERLGCSADNSSLVDLCAAAAWLLQKQGEPLPGLLSETLVPPDMIRFLSGGNRSLRLAREALAQVLAAGPDLRKLRGPRGERLLYALDEVRLLAPVPRPASLRDFMCFEEHSKQSAARRGEPLAKEWYEAPVYYKGNPREIYGPNDEIPWPAYTRRLDFELEVACVVGRRGRDLNERDAGTYIAGYTILNDFSARDAQKREMVTRMGPGKGKDFATALGPYLWTPDEMPDLDAITMAVKVNGELWSEGRFQERYWDFATILSHISQEETIYPGDVFGSGCYYKGCGYDLDRWIKPGDTVELDVRPLGVLRNRIGAPKDQGREGPLRYERHRPATASR